MLKSDLKMESAAFANGHFGDVFRGTDTIHGRVAVKVLKRMLGEKNSEWLLRGNDLIKEGKNLKKASHHNVVQVLNLLQEESSGAIHLVTEFCEDGSLENDYKKGPIEIERLRNISSQICSGLSNVHAQRLIHGDIKPGHILSHNGVVKIADFGLV